MKYLTRELWAAHHHGDPVISAQAEKQMNRNYRAYWKYVDEILPKLTKQTARFIKKVCLHDGSLESFKITERDRPAGSKVRNHAELEISHPEGKYIYICQYSNIAKCTIDYPPDYTPDPYYPYSLGEWHYDEWRLITDNLVRHEIQFSSRVILLLEFKYFSYRRIRDESGWGWK